MRVDLFLLHVLAIILHEVFAAVGLVKVVRVAEPQTVPIGKNSQSRPECNRFRFGDLFHLPGVEENEFTHQWRVSIRRSVRTTTLVSRAVEQCVCAYLVGEVDHE